MTPFLSKGLPVATTDGGPLFLFISALAACTSGRKSLVANKKDYFLLTVRLVVIGRLLLVTKIKDILWSPLPFSTG